MKDEILGGKYEINPVLQLNLETGEGRADNTGVANSLFTLQATSLG